jgi:hypothetical protein
MVRSSIHWFSRTAPRWSDRSSSFLPPPRLTLLRVRPGRGRHSLRADTFDRTGRPVPVRHTHRLHVGAASARAPCPHAHASGTPDAPKKPASRSSRRPAPGTKARSWAVCRRATARSNTGTERHTPARPNCQQAPVSAAGIRAFRALGTNRKSGGWDGT